MLDYLLNTNTMAFAAAVFTTSCLLLISKGKKISPDQRRVAILVCLLCLVYGAFILWVSIGFGAPPPAAPVPAPAYG